MKHLSDKSDPRQGPLAGIMVLDLSRVLAGPYCTMMLGDMGATVIKVEHPGEGDDTRRFGPPYAGGESAYYLGLNRNKYGITLDFSTPEGKERVLNLVKKADILVQNFRCGNDGLFRGLCRLLQRDDLARDPRFATNSLRLSHREELINILQAIFLKRDTADWLASLREAGIPSSPINTVSEALRDEQLAARGLIWECEHPSAGNIRLVGSPMHFSETPTRLYKTPPLLGEDNEMILESNT